MLLVVAPIRILLGIVVSLFRVEEVSLLSGSFALTVGASVVLWLRECLVPMGIVVCGGCGIIGLGGLCTEAGETWRSGGGHAIACSEIGCVRVIPASRVLVVVPADIRLRLTVELNAWCCCGVVSAILCHGRVFFILVEIGAGVVGCCCCCGGCSGNIAVEPLPSSPAKHEENEGDDSRCDAETDDDENGRDRTGVVEEASAAAGGVRGRPAGRRIVHDLGDGVDLSLRIRTRHGLRDQGWRGGDGVTRRIGGSDGKSGGRRCHGVCRCEPNGG